MRKDLLKRVARSFELFKETLNKGSPFRVERLKVEDTLYTGTVWKVKGFLVECDVGTEEGSSGRAKVSLEELLRVLNNQRN